MVKHLLCQGFQKDVTSRFMNRGENGASSIPGVQSVHPNSHVTSMKGEPWPKILALMGKEGERSMIDLIIDCGIFLVVGSGRATYHQLSGKSPGKRRALLTMLGQPLGDLQILPASNPPAIQKQTARSPSGINFVRNRMMYARAALNAQGGVRFGLRHIRK